MKKKKCLGFLEKDASRTVDGCYALFDKEVFPAVSVAEYEKLKKQRDGLAFLFGHFTDPDATEYEFQGKKFLSETKIKKAIRRFEERVETTRATIYAPFLDLKKELGLEERVAVKK